MSKKIKFTSDSEIRLDKGLSQACEAEQGSHALSRSQLQSLIESGAVKINDKIVDKPSFKTSIGDKVVLTLPERKETKLTPTPLDLKIIFEDKYLLVIDKPAGLSVHPGAGTHKATLVQAVLAHVGDKLRGVGESDRPGIVHRLDKDTTGLIVVAKDVATHARLAKMFAAREVSRSYLALVLLTPRSARIIRNQDSGEIDKALARDPKDRKKRAIVTQGGKKALTRWKVIERMTFAALIEATLATGRTHQIRVHMESVGSPVIGDMLYGEFSLLPHTLRIAAKKFGRQALHAATLSFIHPHTEKQLSFKSELPADLENLIKQFRDE